MPLPSSLIKRRHWLQRAGGLTAGAALPGWAQSGKATSAANSLVVAQLGARLEKRWQEND